MRKVLCTVGTSLISNAARSGLKEPTPAALTDFINRTGEALACAETNSLSRLLHEDDRLFFLHSQTNEGKLCAETLCSYYEKKGFRAQTKEITSLTYAHDTFALRGLKALIDVLIEEIRLSRRMNMETIINATGGFKAEIAYATLVGLIFKIPVYYIHEVFKDIIEMPPLPIDWDPSFFIAYEDFFNWISSDFRSKDEVMNRIKGLPADIALFLMEDNEGYITLSPAGNVYYQAFCDLKKEASKVKISTRAYTYFSKLDPTQKEAFIRLIRKINLEQVRNSYARQVTSSDCLVYPKGYCKERVYFYTDDEYLYICELAQHGDNYELLLAKGVKKDAYKDFVDVEIF